VLHVPIPTTSIILSPVYQCTHITTITTVLATDYIALAVGGISPALVQGLRRGAWGCQQTVEGSANGNGNERSVRVERKY
jgi:hypothetical protein